MAVEVITKGLAPSEKQYDVWCQSCRSHLRFKRQDAEMIDDQRDGAALKVDCPVCTVEVWVRLRAETP